MAIIGTFKGWNIVALPSDVLPRVTAPSSIEWDPQAYVEQSESPFDGQTQTYDWMQSRLDGQVSFPPMTRWSHDAWAAFIRSCRGPLNVFLLGDPKARLPKGSALGTAGHGAPFPTLGGPVVDGDAQTGFTLRTREWKASVRSILLPNDYISIGYRMYSVTDAVDSDSTGHATLPLWQPLRESPADGDMLVTRNCKGLFRLKTASGNRDSVNVGAYGFSGFAIKEAL